MQPEAGIPKRKEWWLQRLRAILDPNCFIIPLPTASGLVETDPTSFYAVFLKLDQSTSQTVAGGSPTFEDGVLITSMTPPGAPAADQVHIYSEDFKGFSFLNSMDSTGMVRQLVRDSVFVGKNTTASAIPVGTVVYASGSSMNVPTIAPARSNAIATMPAIGMTVEEIDAGAFGRIMQIGLLENFNTNAFTEGDVVYVSSATAGALTATPPTFPNIRQELGAILVKGVGNGAMQVISRSMLYEPIIDHSGLLNLGNDDHPQYFRLDQTVPQTVTGGIPYFSSSIDVANIDIRGGYVLKWWNLDKTTQYSYMLANGSNQIIASVNVPFQLQYGAVGAAVALSLDTNGNVVWNYDAEDCDFSIKKLTAGVAYSYTAATDKHAFSGAFNIGALPVYANNAAAVAGGLASGDLYRTNGDPDPVCVVH